MPHARGFTQSHWMLLPGEYFAVSPRQLPWSLMLVPVQSHTKHNFLASVSYEKIDRPIEFFGKCKNDSDLVNTSIE
jgi:hypothetical protein